LLYEKAGLARFFYVQLLRNSAAGIYLLKPRAADGTLAIHTGDLEKTMSTMMSGQGGNAHGSGRGLLRVAVGTGAILLVPLLAMQFTSEVNWTGLDFAAAAVLLLCAGGLLELALRTLRGTRQRLAAGALLGLAFLYAWAELAVGIFFHLGS